MQTVTSEHWPYPAWIAHRGAGKLAPENTLAAFKLGASHGYRMFECDVKLSADGVPFLLHDNTLNRTTTGKGTAGEQTWRELSQLDAGSWHQIDNIGSFTGEPLPTLANIAQFCLKNGYFLNIEIKATPSQEVETGKIVAEHAARLWQDADNLTVFPPLLTSFHPETLEAAQAAAPHLPRGLLLDTLWKGWLETALTLDCSAIVCNHALWDTSSVTQAKSAGFRCLSYTVNDEWAAKRLLDLGTDGIITDRVELFSPS